jgi:hypothetical protein
VIYVAVSSNATLVKPDGMPTHPVRRIAFKPTHDAAA